MLAAWRSSGRGSVLKSEVKGRRYLVHGRLGGSGFGDAHRVTPSSTTATGSCQRLPEDHARCRQLARRGFFSGLLKGDSHAVQMIDAFPALVGSGRAVRLLFCIGMELIVGGTVSGACFGGGPPHRRRPFLSLEAAL